MDLSMSFTKGLHNLPKHWGDDTVRPQAKVSDFKSGARAAGKEFGLGWYDGVTGLVTQPWNGARKKGASGFVKGIGKGMGEFVAKPGAGAFGILGYVMKGVHKEVQKVFGSNVQNYIIASRTAQGYEEWLQSSDAEKKDVIARWKLIQKHLKKKGNPEEMVRDVLEAQRNVSMEDKEARQDHEYTASSSTQSLREQRQRSSDSEWESGISLSNEECEAAGKRSEKMAEKAADVAGFSPRDQHSSLSDAGHLAGTTQSEFKVQQLGYGGEKTTQEKTEEEIVMEYVKKQSLLEQHHQDKGKGRATATEDEKDEDLQQEGAEPEHARTRK
jgi:uncharacterized protein (DUF1330 family)